jgi:hypothetical protein
MYGILKDFGLPAYLVGIAILVSIAYKRIKEHQVKNLHSTKEQLDAITSLITDDEKMKNKFLVEQVFHYKFGNYIPFSIIKVLLTFNNPTEAIKNWVLAKRHLITKHEPIRFEYRSRLLTKKYRRNWLRILFIGYFSFATLGLGILFSMPRIFVSVHYAWIIGSGVLVLYMLYVAYEFILSAQRIKAAEEIMEEVKTMEKQT